MGETESFNLYAYCHNDPVNKVDVLGLFETQYEVDSLRMNVLLGQLAQDPGKLPVALPQELLDASFIKYAPNAEKFGMFKPFGAEDYDRAYLAVRNAGAPTMRSFSWEEAENSRLAAQYSGREWIPSTTAALTLGAANTAFNASINEGFLVPSGAGSFAFGLVKNARLLSLLQAGARCKLGEVLNPSFAGRPGFARGSVNNPFAANSIGRSIAGTPGIVTGGSSSTLGKNILEAMGFARNIGRRGTQAQHLIPSELGTHPVLQRLGMNLDEAGNGLLLPSASAKPGISALPRHTGSHPAYTGAVRQYLDGLDGITDLGILDQEILGLQQKLRRLHSAGTPVRNMDGATTELWYRLLTQ